MGEREVKPRLRGDAYEVRYADDFILCFQYREDAERVLKVLSKRFGRFGLSLHPDKTRLIEFGRVAQQNTVRRGEKKLANFDFLGLTHICAQSRRGRFTVHVRTMRKRLRRFRGLVRRTRKKWLNRRHRGKTINWATYAQILHRHPLLRPRITPSRAGTGSRA